jgi:hypothetical protein
LGSSLYNNFGGQAKFLPRSFYFAKIPELESILRSIGGKNIKRRPVMWSSYSIPNNDGLKVACSWEEFIAEAKVERLGRDEWRVMWRRECFHVKYESFIMFPRPLCGASVFRIEKYKAGWQSSSYPSTVWTIHIKAEKGIRWRKRDILRVAWSHSGRREGDNCYTLYDYDRLVKPKFRPRGAIGKAINIPGNIRRWKLETNSLSIAERYRYFSEAGREEGVILIETPNGYKWENSISQGDRRFESLAEAEKEVIDYLQKDDSR